MDPGEQFGRVVESPAPLKAEMDFGHFRDLSAHRHHRIEAGGRVLKDEADVLAVTRRPHDGQATQRP